MVFILACWLFTVSFTLSASVADLNILCSFSNSSIFGTFSFSGSEPGNTGVYLPSLNTWTSRFRSSSAIELSEKEKNCAKSWLDFKLLSWNLNCKIIQSNTCLLQGSNCLSTTNLSFLQVKCLQLQGSPYYHHLWETWWCKFSDNILRYTNSLMILHGWHILMFIIYNYTYQYPFIQKY